MMSLLLVTLLVYTGPAQAGGIIVDVDIEKFVNGVDADTAPGIFVPVGSIVTFTYTLENFGLETLPFPVSINDDNGTPSLFGDDFAPTFVGGDTTPNGFLDPDETWTYTASRTALVGLHTNIAVVFALGDGAGPFDSDPANYFGQAPAGQVPSPAPLVLIGSGLAALAYLRRLRPGSRS